ncbi:MAG: hypothetical protein PHX08_18310, partial [Lachnospiraceae bacterium]|nr:hypothetical protein [Lachnospiraceae bacterium]
GMYFIMIFGIALILNKLKEKKNIYYKQLLKINSLYYRFFANVNMLFIISVLIYIVVYFFSLKVTDNLPVDVSNETYPYDLVWMADEEDKVLLADLQQKYAITYEQVPIIRVTTAEYGENIGMSEREFYKWSGQDISLKGRDIYIIYQRNEQAGNTIGISWGDTKPLIHIGKGEKYFWYMYGTDFSTPSYQYFSKNYKVKGTKTNNLIGQLRDNMNENIILFSNEYYEQVKEKAEGASLMVLINIPDSNREIVKAKINDYAKTHSEKYFVDNTIGVYDKDYMIIKDKAQRIMNLTMYIFMILLIVICSILILGMKIFVDIDDMIEKDQFFSCLGMNKKERKKILRAQCRAASWIPIGMGIITGAIFLVREIELRGMSNEVEIIYWKTVDILIAIYLIIYLIAAIIVEYMVVRTVESEQRS